MSDAAKVWSEVTGVPLPQCKMQGCCCRGASPSVPYHQLLRKAAQGETFARDFFTIFVPYDSHESARAVEAGLVERTLKAAEKDSGFEGPEDVVFYKCRYIGDDNKCQIWEDRPQLCRAYPDTPFVVFAPGCAFEPWSKAVRAKYAEIQEDLKNLKKQKQSLERLQQAAFAHGGGRGTEYTKIDVPIDSINNEHEDDSVAKKKAAETIEAELKVVMPLVPMYLASPLASSFK